MSYGKQHENVAISSYIHYQKGQGRNFEVIQCGLVVDKVEFRLAASPDGIVTDLSQPEHKRGCLEVKCPFTCKRISILEACRQVSAFCLVEEKGVMHLSKSHSYYYQIQTQMHVTNLNWCDFFVWCPKQIFVQQIGYDSVFMKNALQTAKKFYFEKFLPAVAPCMIIKSKAFQNNSSMRASHPVKDEGSSELSLGSLLSRQCLAVDSDTKPPKIITASVVKCDTADDIQLIGATKTGLIPLQDVLFHVKARKHAVKGDGNCLYHTRLASFHCLVMAMNTSANTLERLPRV